MQECDETFDGKTVERWKISDPTKSFLESHKTCFFTFPKDSCWLGIIIEKSREREKQKKSKSEIHVFKIVNRFLALTSILGSTKKLIPQPAKKEVNFLHFFILFFVEK